MTCIKLKSLGKQACTQQCISVIGCWTLEQWAEIYYSGSGSGRRLSPGDGTNNEQLVINLAAVPADITRMPQLLKCFNVRRNLSNTVIMTQPDIKYGLEIPYDRTVDELLAIVKQPAPICWTGYIALAHKKSDESIQALSSLLDNQDWTHQRAAIEAIGNHIYGLQLEIKLLALLNHPNNFIVSASIKALTNLQSANSHDRIKSFISSDNMELQKYAIEGISKIWEGSDYKFLLDLYINLTNEDVRKTIGFVLVDHTNKSNWKTFFDTFSIDKVSRHREWALTIGNEFASDKNIIKQFLNDPDGHVRNKAKRLADMGCA